MCAEPHTTRERSERDYLGQVVSTTAVESQYTMNGVYMVNLNNIYTALVPARDGLGRPTGGGAFLMLGDER